MTSAAHPLSLYHWGQFGCSGNTYPWQSHDGNSSSTSSRAQKHSTRRHAPWFSHRSKWVRLLIYESKFVYKSKANRKIAYKYDELMRNILWASYIISLSSLNFIFMLELKVENLSVVNSREDIFCFLFVCFLAFVLISLYFLKYFRECSCIDLIHN